MDFNSLMAKMRELDQPAPTAQEMPVAECGPEGMPQMAGAVSPQAPTPPHNPPSLSVNLNAQGMDDIESIMKLMTKVNPDMINQPDGIAPPMPSLSAMPSLMPPGPSISSIGDLGNLDAGPLKMLPDLDKEPEGDHAEPDADNMGGPSDMDADNMPGGMDTVSKDQGDQDNDGDHDMDDHDMEPKDDKEDDEGNEPKSQEKKTDEWANEPDPELKSTDYMLNKLSGGLGRQQTMTKHGYQQGDNPLAMRENLRASIKQELAQRLAEAKSEKFDPLKHVKNPTKGEKDAAKDVKRGSYADRAAMLKSAEKDGRLKEANISELSKGTLKSYQDKAGKDIVNTMTSGDYMTTDKSAKKVMNRMKGSEKADNKIWKKDNA